jgi:hypothetical protein
MEIKMNEDKKGVFRPRFMIIMLVAVVVAQMFSVNYLNKEISLQKFENEKRLSECYETMNTMSIMQGALVNILVEKDVLDRSQLLNEAQKMSVDLKNMMDRMKANENGGVETPERITGIPTEN